MQIEHLLGPSELHALDERMYARISGSRSCVIIDYAYKLRPYDDPNCLLVLAQSWEMDSTLVAQLALRGVELVVLYKPRIGYGSGRHAARWEEFLPTLTETGVTIVAVNDFWIKDMDAVPRYEPWATVADLTFTLDTDAG